MASIDPTIDQRYAEKLAARKEGRDPAIAAPAPAFPEGAGADERYRAKLAARAAGASAPAADPKTEKPKGAESEAVSEEAKLEEATRPDPKTEKPKGDRTFSR